MGIFFAAAVSAAGRALLSPPHPSQNQHGGPHRNPSGGTPESRNCYEFLGFYGLIEVDLRNWFQCQRTATKKE